MTVYNFTKLSKKENIKIDSNSKLFSWKAFSTEPKTQFYKPKNCSLFKVLPLIFSFKIKIDSIWKDKPLRFHPSKNNLNNSKKKEFKKKQNKKYWANWLLWSGHKYFKMNKNHVSRKKMCLLMRNSGKGRRVYSKKLTFSSDWQMRSRKK